MSYCVHCGVELDATAPFCPLCHTPVQNPRQPVDTTSPRPFPTERREVPPASKRTLAVLLTTIYVTVGTCCGVLNFFLGTERTWSLYVIGAVIMFFIWTVPPLLHHKRDTLRLQLLADILAIAIYVSLIAMDLDGWHWYLHLALPIILLLAAIFLFLGITMGKDRRSTLSRLTLIIGCTGVFVMGIEFFGDIFFHGSWRPVWSLIVFTICLILMIPLIVIRHVPSLREEVRRRFHM